MGSRSWILANDEKGLGSRQRRDSEKGRVIANVTLLFLHLGCFVIDSFTEFVQFDHCFVKVALSLEHDPVFRG